MTKVQTALFSLPLICVFLISCSSSEASFATQTNAAQNSFQADSQTTSAARKIARFENVSFSYDAALFETVKAEIAPAILLERPDDKPDSTTSQYVKFTFTGAYNDKYKSYNEPEIRVLKIAEFKQAFAVKPRYKRMIEKEIEELEKIINGKTDETKYYRDETEFPYLPMRDGAPSFIVRFKRVNFENGKGVFFLTQRDFEASLIENKSVQYIYQGITNDKKHYILAEFPISTKILADGDDNKSHNGYSIPYPIDTDEKLEQFEKYVSDIARQLNELPPQEFEPNLISLENVINSLKVE